MISIPEVVRHQAILIEWMLNRIRSGSTWLIHGILQAKPILFARSMIPDFSAWITPFDLPLPITIRLLVPSSFFNFFSIPGDPE